MTNLSRRLKQHWFSRSVAWFLSSAVLATGAANAFLTDNGIHPPPTVGTFAYNSFRPGASGFPAVGGSYTDPVFGSAVLRLSARSGQGNDQLYAHHFANANGTFAFELSGAVDRVINTATGAVLWSGAQVPTGTFSSEIAWDPVDPDKYYFFSGASLIRRSLAAQTNTTMRTFPGTLQSQGGSLNYISANGRYFLVKYSGTSKVWDSQTNTIYSGSVPPVDAGGWTTITPDGNYVVTVAGNSAMPQQEHYSYAINHGTQSIALTPTQFWGMSGDHATVMSASDGKSYYIGFNSFDDPPGVYRVDITLNQAGRTVVQQTGSNLKLIDTGFFDSGGHLCAVSTGPLRDWVFLSTETDNGNSYNGGVGGWRAYQSEIIAVNVLTTEVRRLAHHRSRGLDDGSYWNQPRISCSWDGSVVMWDSNFNISSPFGYADLYAILNPLSAGGPPIPQNLRFK